VKLYKADAYSADAQVSYYLKGAVVALCLDLHLRRNGGSLMEVLRQLWLSHGRWGRGYSEADLVQAFATHAPDLATQLPRWLRELDDPDLDGYLSSVGLFLDAEMASTPWAGLTTRQEAGGLMAARVVRGAPAEQAGVMVGDELVALDGQRLKSPDDLQRALRSHQCQTLLIARRSQLRSLELHPQAPHVERYLLKRVANATDEQMAAQHRWLLQQPAQVG
jgi:predicted metalloprotease with PDZ domain